MIVCVQVLFLAAVVLYAFKATASTWVIPNRQNAPFSSISKLTILSVNTLFIITLLSFVPTVLLEVLPSIKTVTNVKVVTESLVNDISTVETITRPLVEHRPKLVSYFIALVVTLVYWYMLLVKYQKPFFSLLRKMSNLYVNEKLSEQHHALTSITNQLELISSEESILEKDELILTLKEEKKQFLNEVADLESELSIANKSLHTLRGQYNDAKKALSSIQYPELKQDDLYINLTQALKTGIIDTRLPNGFNNIPNQSSSTKARKMRSYFKGLNDNNFIACINKGNEGIYVHKVVFQDSPYDAIVGIESLTMYEYKDGSMIEKEAQQTAQREKVVVLTDSTHNAA